MPDITLDPGYMQRAVEEIYNETGGFSIDKAKVLVLIKPGIFIKTQVSNSYVWYANTILDIKGDMLMLPFTKNDALFAVLEGDIMRFRFAVDKFDLNFLCTIMEIDCRSTLPTKLIKVLKVEIWRNKRGSTRHSAGFVCRSVSEMQEKFISYLTNISDSGGGIICRENLRIGSNIKLSFFTPDGTTMDLIATAVRSKKIHDNKVEYGIRFFNLNPDAGQKILEIIDREKLHENSLYLEICKKYNIEQLP